MGGMTAEPLADPRLPDYPARVLATLAAGAAGDAYGYTVEFDRADAIVSAWGPVGLGTPAELLERLGVEHLPISDDTQMTLFVSDGLREWIEWQNRGQMADAAACVWLACLRWHRTQTGALPQGAPPAQDTWLDARRELHERRAPGNACLSGLAEPGMGVPTDPKNPDSKGCGTIMRSAPYGMVPGLPDTHVASFARQGAVLTHGHPTAWTSAAAFALIVDALFAGRTLTEAVETGRAWLAAQGEDAAESLTALELARELAVTAERDDDGTRLGAPGHLPVGLGEGWVAEEALAIAVYAALVAERTTDTPAAALALALRIGANHDGDSDSTASLAGQLLGAAHGMAVFGVESADGVPVAALADAVPDWIAERDVVVEAAERWVAATS
ncbi:ADP-ribosylglycohydrolase family protein [Micrococcus sp. FDAARGOS_333]|nr:ADP-ribosylglycohydrolase family protein [Micrococcus sp. FDAARGOS_333]